MRDAFARRLLELIPDGEVQKTATRAGVALESLMRWRNGTEGNPQLATIEKLATALDVPGPSLLSDAPDPSVSDVREHQASYQEGGDDDLRSQLGTMVFSLGETFRLLRECEAEKTALQGILEQARRREELLVEAAERREPRRSNSATGESSILDD